MYALTFDFKTKSLKTVKKQVPLFKDREVLVRVAYAGICGTDLHILQGEFPCKQDGPITLGHEFSGIVESVGKEVTCVSIGDNVCVDPNHGCDVCKSCHIGNPHFCKVGGLNNTIGIYRDGGWAQYVVVPDTQVHKLSEQISLEQGALCEPLSCLVHGWDRISPLTIGQNVLIVGAGIIGSLWLSVLHLHGHQKVTVSEPNKNRMKFIQKAFPIYNFLGPEELDERKDGDPTYGFDVVIDCSGNNKGIEQGFSFLNDGGKLCIFGVASPHAKISLYPYEIFKKELTILGVNINPHTFPKSLALAERLGDRYLNYDVLGIKMFKLDEYADALENLKKGLISKAVFQISHTS